MTDLEIIKDAIDTIGNIVVPIKYKELIADPLSRVGHNLLALYQTCLNEAKKAQSIEEKEEDDAEPTAEPVPEIEERPDSE